VKKNLISGVQHIKVFKINPLPNKIVVGWVTMMVVFNVALTENKIILSRMA
jgi:hypothetical protein